MVQWRALGGSALVNFAGLTAAALPLPAPANYPICRRSGSAATYIAAKQPALFMLGHRGPETDVATLHPRPLDRDGAGCPPSVTADEEPVPAFPVLGTGRPFVWLAPAEVNPAFCVRIGRDGRVTEILVARSSGDPATDRALRGSIRRLRFVAARAGGRPVASWQRLIVNRARNLSWRISHSPEGFGCPA
jgi:TonB family protein